MLSPGSRGNTDLVLSNTSHDAWEPIRFILAQSFPRGSYPSGAILVSTRDRNLDVWRTLSPPGRPLLCKSWLPCPCANRDSTKAGWRIAEDATSAKQIGGCKLPSRFFSSIHASTGLCWRSASQRPGRGAEAAELLVSDVSSSERFGLHALASRLKVPWMENPIEFSQTDLVLGVAQNFLRLPPSSAADDRLCFRVITTARDQGCSGSQGDT
jgi:hypothetical protein